MNLEPEASERRLRRLMWGLVVLLPLLGLLWSLGTAAALLAGGVLSALNLEAIVRMVGVVTAKASASAGVAAAFNVGFRYLLLGLALFVILGVWQEHVVALSVGLSAPVGAVFLEWTLLSIREFGSE